MSGIFILIGILLLDLADCRPLPAGDVSPVLPAVYPVRTGVTTAELRVPAVDDVLNVKSLGGVQISPDGRWAA